MNEIEAACLEQLSILNQHESSSFEQTATYLLARTALYGYLHGLYYGIGSTVGLRDAQLFNVNGKGEQYNEFLNAIDRHGLREYMQQLAERNRLTRIRLGIGPYSVSEEECELYERIFSAEETPDATEKQRFLIHYSMSNTIPAVVELGCLASDRYRESTGLTKESGESKRGPADFVDEHEVCFWPWRVTLKGSNLDCTYGKTRFNIGLEYPIAWGINVEHGTDLPIVDGAWPGEKAIADKIDLAIITNLWVAPFDVNRIADILAAHGYGHIIVQPFINPLQQSRFREIW